MMYVQDYDETYPQAEWYKTSAQKSYWFYDVQPYVSSFQVFLCPSSSQGFGPSAESYSWDRYNHAYIKGGNYGANEMLFRDYRNSPPIRLSAVQSPATTYMIMDSGYFHIFPDAVTKPGDDSTETYLPGTGALGLDGSGLASRFKSDFNNGRHFGGVNVTFADGHVKWLKSSEVYTQAKKMTDAGWTYAHPTVGIDTPSQWNPWTDNN